MKLTDLIPDLTTPKTLLRKLREYTRKLWVRVCLLGFLAFLALGLTQLVEPLVPKELAGYLSGSAADRLLNVIANAMLAATIFSLTVMVSVYRASSDQFTPRVHRLIIQDRTTQNTIAVFIGTYVYALLGIILRELGIYQDDRAFVLFIMTCLVLVVIVIYLIRWTLHLQTFGSLLDTARQIEETTSAQFKERLRNPCLGARALTGEIPEDCKTVAAPESGYVKHVYPEALNAAAQAFGVEIYLRCNIGKYVFVNEPYVSYRSTGEPDEEAQAHDSIEDAIAANIVLGDVRTYDQDPRFGLMVLGEIASKALSPGINDPGTAIDVITRVGRILSLYKDETQIDRDDPLDNLYVKPLDPGDLLEDGFGSLARDGEKIIEVQHRLQRILAGLMQHPDKGLRDAARVAARTTLRRSLQAMMFDRDRERLINVIADDIVEEAQAEMEEAQSLTDGPKKADA